MRKLFTVFTAAVMLSMTFPLSASASGQNVIANEWVDEEKGPGVAKWIDENGNEAEPPVIDSAEEAEAKPDSMPDGPGEMVQTQDTSQENAENVGGGEQPAQENAGGSSDNAEQEASGDSGSDQKQAEEAEAQPAANESNQAGGRQIDPGKPMVALTFDDGPYAPVGNQIMDCLAQYGAKATFYVVGNRCRTYQTEMQRMVAEGHEIGNHTYEHKYLNKLNTAQIRQQIDKGADAIEAVCGVRPATVRLPGGNKNATVLAAVQEPIILWNLDTQDWKTRNTGQTVSKVLNNVKDGDIILMHELYGATGNAVLQIVPELTRRGFQMVTVSEMAQYRGGLQNGKVYSSMR